MSSTQGGFFDGLLAAARENPLGAALIGGGALWLLVGNEKLKSAANSAAATVSPLVDIAARSARPNEGLQRTAAPPTAPEMSHGGSFGESLRNGANTVSDAASGAAGKIRDSYEGGVGYAREQMRKVGNVLPDKESFAKAHTSLGAMLEQQPLVIGMVGLAIGAAMAGAFQTFKLENDWLGELSDGVKGDLSMRAGAVSESLRGATETMKAELSDTGAEALDRLKQVGMDAADAARETVTTPSSGAEGEGRP